MARNHHIRERRLKLGMTQYELGCLAFLSPRSAQNYVSGVERGKAPARYVDKVRRALIWAESAPRRLREDRRRDEAALAALEALLPGVDDPAVREVVVERLVDMLWDCRTEDFDAMAARLPMSIVEEAGTRYVDGCTPLIGP